jgi:hypothetical protein
MNTLPRVWLTLDGGFVLDIGFVDHFNTQFVSTLNYSTITNFHILQITAAHAKSFPACSVFTSSCLVTASNNDYSSASGLKSSLIGCSLQTAYSCSSCPPYNSSARTTVEDTISDSNSPPLLHIDCCHGNLFVYDRCLETALVYLLISWSLHSNSNKNILL